MSLKFNCKKCGEEIVSKYLKPGETAECKGCKTKNIVPEDSEVIEEAPKVVESTDLAAEKNSEKKKKKEKKSFFPPDMMDYKPIFREFEENGGRVDIKWNKAAFGWGAIWPFVKGMWAYSLIYFGLFVISASIIDPTIFWIIVPILWIFNGMYGNYMLYKFRTTKLQLEQTVITRLFSLYFFILSILVFIEATQMKETVGLFYLVIGTISLFGCMVGIVMSNGKSKDWKVLKVDELD